MNVRIIDPRRPSAGKPRAWGREVVEDDFGDLDEAGEGAAERPSCDDRFDLLLELRWRLEGFLAACLEDARAERLPGGAFACFAARCAELKQSREVLERTMSELGLEVPPLPAGPPEGVFGALPFPAEEVFRGGAEMVGGAMFLNSLGTTMAAALLCEGDAPAWRGQLLPMLQDDCRFEGRLKGFLEDAGDRAVALGRDCMAVAQGVKPVSAQRLWSFDLLRLAIRRLLGEGHSPAAGGAFPVPGGDLPRAVHGE